VIITTPDPAVLRYVLIATVAGFVVGVASCVLGLAIWLY
jgi:hypothetical protein